MTTSLSYQISYSEQHIIKVTAKGLADVTQMENMYQDVLSQAKDNSCENILFDATAMVSNYPLTEFLPLVNRLKPRLTGFKLARLCDIYEHRQDLIETVGNKENLTIKNFAAEAEATNWLLGAA